MRMRSCFRLTDSIMLDLGADAVSQSARYGEISQINHVLVSHTHDDHLSSHMLMEAMWSRNYRKTLHYYFTDQAYEIVDHWKKNKWILKGNAGENAALYLIELPNGKTLFYGLDSGIYFPETIEAIKGHVIDIFISETTLGTQDISHPFHMSLKDVRALTEALPAQGTLHEQSRLFLTHINHGTSYRTLCQAIEKDTFPIDTVVAYDGLRIFE